MKCPLYYTAHNRNIDYKDVVSLHKKIMWFISKNHNFIGDNVFIFEDENYIVNDDISVNIIKKRKELTSFTELVVRESLKKLGYSWIIVLPDPMAPIGVKRPHPERQDKLCFKICTENEMLYYSEIELNEIE